MKFLSFLFLLLSLIFLPNVFGQVQVLEKSIQSSSFFKQFEKIGMNYFSFWEGPSLEDGQTGRNELSRPLDSGLSLFNLVSITYKLNERYNFDLQNRLEWIHTQDQEWRFQGIRAGFSGKLLSGDTWSLRGAINTDIPELNGRDARARTVLFNPGLFAGLTWNFHPKWSLYTIMSPRVFFYQNDEAVEPEWALSGRSPGQKPRAIIQAAPTINYAFTDTVGLRSGLDFQFRQFVQSEVGFLKRWPTAWTVGPTFSISKSLNIYTFVQTWPFVGNGLTRETASIGMWISGVLF
jgi:hypothetical protein